MQTGEDGEYIPERELDRNFKIPKRPISNDVNFQSTSSQVMDNSYFNVENMSQYQFGWTNYFPVVQQQSSKRPLPNKLLKETIPDCDDATLPIELIEMFQPLYCKLCTAQLSSNVVAKLHYKSKSHEKKIRKFLVDYSERTGEPLHKRARVCLKNAEFKDDNPMYYYCDVCSLPLTGKLHAESHYMGKNHRKTALGQKVPTLKGYYNAEGKWIRQELPKNKNGSDSFGLAFQNNCTSKNDLFKCDICNITTTCKEQLESHYSGQKHQKKLRQQQQQIISNVNAPSDNILVSVLCNSNMKGDFSAYRTPSGQYYCQNCNISVNAEVQFKQHLNSKKHLSKIKNN